MRWINCDPMFLPHLADLLEISYTSGAAVVAEFDDVTPVAAVLFDGYNGSSIHGHIWIAPGRKPSRAWWYAVFHYAFQHCGVTNLIGTVPSSNKGAQKLDEHLGFRLNSVIPGYYPCGDDMMIYVCTPYTVIDWRKFAPTQRGAGNGREEQEESTSCA